ncbi:TetR/AcrR family transcriptional regulator [Salinibacterium sp. NSLL150]|nr:TetR/AcrR family transcriptional regulator [Salinibacterium sp. NSLL35]MBH0100420.1 TetR/AcrR family transcriptional regulator [Salinibacterium sp. NSLL150]MBH0103179.1 TetR/AcrR family transcriptional regulator [Salinibacterium sp. NSLL16]MBH0105940.1 TetR/AcrR family transcriptional regulator [Salinibacterium sp. NSLL17]
MLLVSRSDSAYHHGNLGPTLENAALELMRTQGHASLSLREVARTAGVSHNAPYHHFGDRAALLKRLSERSMGELLSTLQAVEEQDSAEGQGQASADSARAHAVAIGAAYVGYAADFPERFRLIYDPSVCIPGSPSAEMKPLLEQTEGVLARATAALLPPEQQAPAAALATAVWGVVHGLAELVVAGHISRAEVEPAMVSLFGVRGD